MAGTREDTLSDAFPQPPGTDGRATGGKPAPSREPRKSAEAGDTAVSNRERRVDIGRVCSDWFVATGPVMSINGGGS